MEKRINPHTHKERAQSIALKPEDERCQHVPEAPHPPMLLSVNEESIELLRDYHFEA